jgi:PAS domain S-box-containing protein
MDDERKTRAELLTDVRALRDDLAAQQAASSAGSSSDGQAARLFTEAFRVNPSAIGITRLSDGRLIDVNDKFVDLLGYPRDEVIGRTSQELGLWAEPGQREQLSRELFAHGFVRDGEARFRTRSGDLLDGRTALAFIDLDGELCVLTVVQNVTDQRRAEHGQRLLLEASSVLATSLDYEPVLAEFAGLLVDRIADWCAIEILGQDGRLHRLVAHAAPVDVDRNWTTVEEPDNKPWVTRPMLMPELTDEDLRVIGRIPSEGARLRSGGARSGMVVPLVARERMLGTMSLVTLGSGRPYRDDDLRLVEDLARRAAMAVDNALLYREAQQALHAREAFLLVAAHELKTPVTLILANAELLEWRLTRDAAVGDRNMSSLRTLSAQARRLDRLIQALLDVSRLQGGDIILHRRSLDLVTLVRQVVEDVAVAAPDHPMTIDTISEPLPVAGDAPRLEQVMHNLLQNAIKYSPAGSPIAVEARRDGADAVISIRDQGIGVPERVIPDLFKPFVRAGNIDPGIAGLGIGLYVVKEIMDLHGGTIDVESAEGRGSTFTLRLPLYEP